MKKLPRSILKRLDIFGQPIRLRLNMKEQFQTACGGFLTLLLFAIFSYIAFDAFINLLSYENLTTSSTMHYEKEPEFIEFDRRNLPLAVSFDPPEYNSWYFESIILNFKKFS
jgi:hypothetical protein